MRPCDLAPGVTQPYGPVEDELPRTGVRIHHEIALSLELKAFTGTRDSETRLQNTVSQGAQGIRVKVRKKISAAGTWLRHHEQSIIKPHLRRDTMPG
jgi:hypothetical protein